MGLFDSAFDPSAFGGGSSSGVLPPWLLQIIAGLQQGPSALQSFPTTPFPMTGYPTGSPIAGSPLTQPGQQPVAQGDGSPAPAAAAPSLPSLSGLFEGGSQGGASSGASESPGIGDRLHAGLLGFAHGGGVLPAIANLISGLSTGARSDPQGMYLAQQAATVRALRSAGLPNPGAIAVMYPALARAILAHALLRSPIARSPTLDKSCARTDDDK
jgi:hypothetical protein